MSKTETAGSEQEGRGYVLDLDSNVINGLAQKIQHNLKKPQQSISHQLPSTRKPSTKKAKIIHEQSTPTVSQPSTQQHGEGSQRDHSVAQPFASKGHSVKRLRDGKAKVFKDTKNARSDVNKTKLGIRPVGQSAGIKSGLEDGVLALGGDAQDLELVIGAGSESDVDGDTGSCVQSQKGDFQHDFQGFFQELGIDQAIQEDFEHEDEGVRNSRNSDHRAKHMDNNEIISTNSLRIPSHDLPNGYERVLEASDAKRKAIARLVSALIICQINFRLISFREYHRGLPGMQRSC